MIIGKTAEVIKIPGKMVGGTEEFMDLENTIGDMDSEGI